MCCGKQPLFLLLLHKTSAEWFSPKIISIILSQVIFKNWNIWWRITVDWVLTKNFPSQWKISVTQLLMLQSTNHYKVINERHYLGWSVVHVSWRWTEHLHSMANISKMKHNLQIFMLFWIFEKNISGQLQVRVLSGAAQNQGVWLQYNCSLF